jgi:hypothetical protein
VTRTTGYHGPADLAHVARKIRIRVVANVATTYLNPGLADWGGTCTAPATDAEAAFALLGEQRSVLILPPESDKPGYGFVGPRSFVLCAGLQAEAEGATIQLDVLGLGAPPYLNLT